LGRLGKRLANVRQGKQGREKKRKFASKENGKIEPLRSEFGKKKKKNIRHRLHPAEQREKKKGSAQSEKPSPMGEAWQRKGRGNQETRKEKKKKTDLQKKKEIAC